jgi:hypothetical protein
MQWLFLGSTLILSSPFLQLKMLLFRFLHQLQQKSDESGPNSPLVEMEELNIVDTVGPRRGRRQQVPVDNR